MSIAKRLKRRMPTVIAVIVLLAVWETWVDLGHVSPTMISAPSEIFAATIETWNTLGPAAAITGYEGVAGFLFAVFFGIMIGIALYCSHTFNAAFYPLLAAAQTMPLISIRPVVPVFWFGFEYFRTKIVIVAVFGLFPTRRADCARTRSSAPVLFRRRIDLRRDPGLDALAREAARCRTSDLWRYPSICRIHLRHGIHR